MSGWQPIETAPKEKTVDLWSTKIGRVANCIQLGDGWWDFSYYQRRIVDATHWMPLPAPPSQEPEKVAA